MTSTAAQQLAGEARLLLKECDPVDGDPGLSEAWELFLDVTNMAGSKLMEHRFGRQMSAADDVAHYMFHLERVAVVGRGAPFAVPSVALRSVKAAGRLLEETDRLDEVQGFLTDLPAYPAAMSEYLVRTAGRNAKPVVDVLDIASRAGSVYRDCLHRSLPF